jgi:hypothetical protein
MLVVRLPKTKNTVELKNIWQQWQEENDRRLNEQLAYAVYNWGKVGGKK